MERVPNLTDSKSRMNNSPLESIIKILVTGLFTGFTGSPDDTLGLSSYSLTKLPEQSQSRMR